MSLPRGRGRPKKIRRKMPKKIRRKMPKKNDETLDYKLQQSIINQDVAAANKENALILDIVTNGNKNYDDVKEHCNDGFKEIEKVRFR